MNKQTIGIAVALLVVAGAVWFLQGGQGVLFMAENAPADSSTTVVATPGAQNPGSVSPGATKPAGSQTSATTKTFSSHFGFSFQYPSSVTLETSAVAPGGFTQPGAIGVVAAYMRMGTVVNRLTVSMSAEPADVGDCFRGSPDVSINGISYSKQESKSSKEGQDFRTIVYRTVRDQTCFELRELIVSTTPDTLPTTQLRAQESNIAVTSAVMDSIINSFRTAF